MKELIERAQSGDPDAVCALVKALWERIERMADYYALRCGEDAGDLMQEAWLGVLDALREVNTSRGDPRQYLLKHAKWRMLDFIKWDKRRQHETLDKFESFTPGDIEEEAVASAFCYQFIIQLNTKQRSLIGYLLAGDTWREAASKLGCTSANVAYHVRQIQQAYLQWIAEDSLATNGAQSTQQRAATNRAAPNPNQKEVSDP